MEGVVGVEVKDGVLDEDGNVVGDNIDDCMLVLSVVKDGVYDDEGNMAGIKRSLTFDIA